VAQWLSGLPAAAQVTLETHQRITNVVRRGDGLVIERESGPLEADLVIAGVGALPNVEWLDGSGLEIDNGVVVDEWAQATADIAALGDIARFTWTSVTGTTSVRIEHWQVASDHAARLAAHWLGESPTAPLIPYFWSDQYGKKIQVLGHPLASDDVQIVSGDVDNGAWLALYQRNGVVSGVVTLSQPRALMKSRPLLEVPTTLVEALDQSPWSA
jgi:NADPH-dependent 2,4-dienoyl-CoA reductase/sulfur reductase-like enzyme